MFRSPEIDEELVYHKIPDEPLNKRFRRIEQRDMLQAFTLLKNYLEKFEIGTTFLIDDFIHWFTPRQNVIDCYVVEDEENNITDLTSFYCVQSIVLDEPNKNIVKGYSFYNVCTKTPWENMLYDTLIAAKNIGVDVFYALDIMDNDKFINSLNFQPTGNSQQYYLYNWCCSPIGREGIGMISV